ncbi:MAG: OmpA family protein [Proteobacteria bacterium]|nr:OmpA family protein [Pseudomonadota bacterium]MBU1640344.1 OmpA family protein [Pseudomonadota bacterium]
MNKKTLGAILLLLLSTATILLIWYLLPRFLDREQKTTSDAQKIKGKIHIAYDNWIGYFPLCSPEMKSQMRRSGWLLVCEDDNADYPGRMKRLEEGEIDLAVATVDSFILNAKAVDYPATITMVIDESKGGDAILARQEKVASLDALKGRNDVKIAFTPGSPSHFLAKAAAEHFNVPEIHPYGPNRIETEGSEKARDKLLSGTVDVAILWEPDVSKALEHKGIKKILGTEDTERLIVDILLVRRQFAKKQPETVKLLMNTYFRVLKKYREDPNLLRGHVKDSISLPEDKIDSMLRGVHWVSFTENCEKWFGIAAPGNYADEGLIDTIESTVRILTSAGDFASNPIPDGDSYRLTSSTFLEELFTEGISGFTKPAAGLQQTGPINSLEASFPALNESAWDTLQEVGTLKIDPIVFQQGSTELGILDKQVVDNAVERLRHYPNFRVIIKGHTATRGDSIENLRLSKDRAEAVSRYLEITYNINQNRVRAVGYGGEKPLSRQAGESQRAYDYRLPRVELVLAREVY